MPHAFRSLMAVAALTLIAGCSTAPKVTSHAMPRVDLSEYQTYGWVERIGTNFGGDETRLTRRFKASVQREMERLGYRYSEESPDMLVNFFVNTREEQDVYTRATRTSPVGYYDYRYGMYTAWPTYRITVQDVDYAVGTVTIDLVDAAKSELVWEGRLEGRLTQRTLTNPGAVVAETVESIFVRFPTRNPRKPDARRN